MTKAMCSLQELARERRGYVTAADARACGVNRVAISRAIAGGTLVRLGARVYRFSATEAHRHERIIVAWLLSQRQRTVVSHWSALTLLGVTAPHDAIHLLAARSGRSDYRPAGTVVHTTARAPLPEELTWRYGVPMTTVTRSLLDIARVSKYDDIAPILRQCVIDGQVHSGRLRLAARDRGGKAYTFVRRFLKTRYRDYIRDKSRGRALYAERMSRVEASPEKHHEIQW